MLVLGRTYYCHRIIYECYNGLIKDGLVIDHIDGYPQNNKLENLQAITQNVNAKQGKTGKHSNSKNAKCIASKGIRTSEERIFQSMTEASIYFVMCEPSVRKVAEIIYMYNIYLYIIFIINT